MKRGFTLMELIVYMALLGFVIVIAGRVFGDSTVMRVRSQSMVKTSEEVGKVSNLIREDLSQMGVKAWGQANSSSSSDNRYNIYNVGENNPKIYWDEVNKDVSSYALYHSSSSSAFFDRIVFRKADFDQNGCFIGIREIEWEAIASSRKLVRRCATVQRVLPTGVNCTPVDNDATLCPSSASSVTIAENISYFNLIPSKPGKAGNSQDTLFGKAAEPDFGLLEVNGGNGEPITKNTYDQDSKTVTLFGFAQNPAGGGTAHNELCLSKTSGGCESFTFEKDETYVIEFKMPFSEPNVSEELQKALNSTQFVPSRDHLAIGLRQSNNPIQGVNDILFFPAQSKEAANLKRSLEFTVNETVANAQVFMTIAYYPPNPSGTASNNFNAAKGMLKFSEFKIFRKADETFHFPKGSGYENYGAEVTGTITPAKIKEKTNAKAFELILEIENKGEKSGTYSIYKEGTNEVKRGMVITTPNNGVVPD